MKRHKDHARRNTRAQPNRKLDSPPAAGEEHRLSGLQPQTVGVKRVHFHEGGRLSEQEFLGLGGPRQRVPMGIEPAGGEHKRKLMIGSLARFPMMAR